MRHALFIRATTPLLLLAVVLWSAFCFIPQAHAATFTFTSCPTGTALHNAVNSASSGDTIQFSISGGPCTIDLSGTGGGTLVIPKTLTFDASGSPQPVTISGGNAVLVVFVNSGVNFTLNTLTIAHGYNVTLGGGIANHGTLRIISSTITSNFAASSYTSGYGGGIYNGGDGTVNISNSSITNNSAQDSPIFAGVGDGIANDYGTVTINNSTIANNGGTGTSVTGGGIANFGTLSILTSTIANNSSYSGGGIYNDGGHNVNISNSTIANNSAAVAAGSGGIWNKNGTVSIAQSIVANNLSGNCAGPITDQGYNLENGTDCTFTASTDQQNTNPQFQGGLQNNGGPTQTIALQPTSPAVNRIPVNTGPGCIPGGTDQRGQPRPDSFLLVLPGTVCDIGAYEVQDLLP